MPIQNLCRHVPQLIFLDFARCCAGVIINKKEKCRNLVKGDFILAEGGKLFRFSRLPDSQLDVGGSFLPVFKAGDPHDLDIKNLGMGVDKFFYLSWVNIGSTGINVADFISFE
jgi:hypothetical protein